MKPVQDAEVSQVKFLKNKDPRVRSRAAENLARLGPQAKFAIFPLSQRLRDADANVRCRAATALGEIGSAAVAELIHALSFPDANIRREAVWALAKMGPEAEPAVGALARVLADRDLAVRKGAARALGLLGRLACPAIPFLIAALNDTDLFFCRLGAAGCRGHRGRVEPSRRVQRHVPGRVGPVPQAYDLVDGLQGPADHPRKRGGRARSDLQQSAPWLGR